MKKIVVAFIAALAVFGSVAVASPANAKEKYPFEVWFDLTMDKLDYEDYELICDAFVMNRNKGTKMVNNLFLNIWNDQFRNDFVKPTKQKVRKGLNEWCLD